MFFVGCTTNNNTQNIENKINVSDSYFILKAYEKWGEKCPEHLLGDFAFAIWDENKDKLFCARDHMGVKNFYYFLSENEFIFATEIKALLINPSVPFELSNKRIGFYLMDITDNESTFYENIFNLSASNSITIKHNNSKKTKYWQIDPNFSIILDSEEEYSTKFFI